MLAYDFLLIVLSVVYTEQKSYEYYNNDVIGIQTRFLRRLSLHAHKYRDNLHLKRIHDARRRNATCMDGSDAKYYISHHAHSKDWVIHLQSGGGCITFDECSDRANGPLGSSIPLDSKITGECMLSNDPKINPTFHQWNKVLIPYCSGDVFVGRQLKANHPYRMPMLGHYIVVAVIKDLIKKYKINRKRTKILFGGTSAGGVGVIANLDHVQELTFPAQVKGYNDGGWFTLFPNFGENQKTNGLMESGLPKFFNTLTNVFEKNWDGFVDESCRKQMPKAAACLYGELAITYLKTPIFVLSNFWDAYQMTQMVSMEYQPVNSPPITKAERNFVSKFGNNTRRSLHRVLLNKSNGVFSPACHAHTFFESCIDGILCGTPKERTYVIDGQSAYGALAEWYESDGRKGSYIDQAEDDPSCNPSCCSIHCYKCRPFEMSKPTVSKIKTKERKKHKNNPIVYYSSASTNFTSISYTLTCLIFSMLWNNS